MPQAGHTSIDSTNMGFIPIIQIYVSFSAHLLKVPEFLYLKNVVFFNRSAFGATPYPFISSAKFFRKDLKVLSITLFPLFDFHSVFAIRIRYRLDFMASRIPSFSSSGQGAGLRPRRECVKSGTPS